VAGVVVVTRARLVVVVVVVVVVRARQVAARQLSYVVRRHPRLHLREREEREERARESWLRMR
jgi:hypothetical protein